jgi:hypothetical protein
MSRYTCRVCRDTWRNASLLSVTADVRRFQPVLPHCLTDTEPDAGIVVNVSIEFISVLFMTSARRHCNPCCAQTSTAAVQASGHCRKHDYREHLHFLNDGTDDRQLNASG